MIARYTRAAIAGLAAGAAGTAAMDAVWYRRYRRDGGTQSPLEWELSSATTSWDDVSAPGKVGRLLLRRFIGDDLPDSWARPTQNIVHWATGMTWGTQYAVLVAARPRTRWLWGLALGTAAWATSYATLPLAGIYQPIWEYDAETLGKDLTAHLTYGAVTGAALAALRGVGSATISNGAHR